ncbi:hypothetical protein GCM10019016_007180 [Streptomyces prasinosporus]|uniref:Sigma 54 modulation/S30EA ribosomal protein C-terminal domain-containing protein n=1 Tax=Streptomyces prasinosporus TaxID=68256 RepID=A0ABP6TEI2_9ACTN
MAAPMTLDQALYEMELVGHDFYLFVDSETKEPSVVYRRHAYDYGVIHLSTDTMVTENALPRGGRNPRRLIRRATADPVPLVRVCAPQGHRRAPALATARCHPGDGAAWNHGCNGSTGGPLPWVGDGSGPQATAFRGRNTMADSFGPMRDEDADDGVVGMGPDADSPRKEPIRVLVVDDHALFRRGVWRSCSPPRRTSRSSGEAGGRRRGRGEGRRPAARHRPDGRADAQAGRASRPAPPSRRWPPARRSSC